MQPQCVQKRTNEFSKKRNKQTLAKKKDFINLRKNETQKSSRKSSQSEHKQATVDKMMR